MALVAATMFVGAASADAAYASRSTRPRVFKPRTSNYSYSRPQRTNIFQAIMEFERRKNAMIFGR